MAFLMKGLYLKGSIGYILCVPCKIVSVLRKSTNNINDKKINQQVLPSLKRPRATKPKSSFSKSVPLVEITFNYNLVALFFHRKQLRKRTPKKHTPERKKRINKHTSGQVDGLPVKLPLELDKYRSGTSYITLSSKGLP